jgi:hypothetical protein
VSPSKNKHNPWFVEFEQQLMREHVLNNNDKFDLHRTIHVWELGHAHFVSVDDSESSSAAVQVYRAVSAFARALGDIQSTLCQPRQVCKAMRDELANPVSTHLSPSLMQALRQTTFDGK